MPRQAQPIFYHDPRRDTKKDDGWWCLNITDEGKRRRVRLAYGRKNRKAAMKRFHQLQAARTAGEPVRTRPGLSGSVMSAVDLFLTHAEKNVKPKTYRGYSDFLNDFLARCPDGMQVGELKLMHVTEWLDEHDTWGKSTKSGAIGAIRRCFKWCFEQGRISAYPFPGLKAPKKAIREVIIQPAEHQRVREVCKDDLKDLLDFLFYSGARPQEARIIEAGHCDLANRRIILPPSIVKGEERHRVIYLADQSLEIITRLKKKRTTGTLFRNSKGKPWTANAVRQRFKRMSKRLGVRYCQYNYRHSFATHALTKGVEAVVLGVMMGHADPSMVGRVYQHVAQVPEYMQEQIKRATG